MRRTLLLVLALVLPRVALAQSPNTDARFRPGANHHLGDDAFIAELGREPTAADEKLRIRSHFLAVRELLHSRAATRPELAAKRAEILAYFDDYIAKGTTPKNEHLPWRTPVFIDDDGTICAVGYLIEHTAGRSVAENIAKSHRYSYLEEIAAAMPEIQKWVEASGLTLEELSSIQPGYEGPEINFMTAWNLKKDHIEDGAYDKDGVRGTIAHHQMEGMWTRTDADGHVVGRGQLVHGAGTWTSFASDGTRLAEGPYVTNQPHGTWKFFHPSGALAAVGKLSHGRRDGKWRFYYDTAERTPIAVGSFAMGDLSGTWKHYDARGELLAVSNPTSEWMFLLEITPGADGVRHSIHQGFDHPQFEKLESRDGEETLYLDHDNIFDTGGARLAQADGAWTASDCGWDTARKRAARRGDLTALHELMYRAQSQAHDDKDHGCIGEARPIASPRARRIEAMLASVQEVRAQSPDFVRQLALGEKTPADGDGDGDEAKPRDADLAKILASNMSWYIEWPHIDGRFVALYKTVAGVASEGGGQ